MGIEILLLSVIDAVAVIGAVVVHARHTCLPRDLIGGRGAVAPGSYELFEIGQCQHSI